jgi:hypothetical protein
MEDEGIELVVKDTKPPSNYDGKVRFINSILAEIKIRKQKHYKKVSLYKKINTTVKAIINGLNAVSVCSIIVSMTPISPFVMILALTTSTVSWYYYCSRTIDRSGREIAEPQYIESAL